MDQTDNDGLGHLGRLVQEQIEKVGLSRPEAEAKKQKPIFAPIPARAVADNRLNGLPLRVLAAIAVRDRLSQYKGSRGCIASMTVLCHDVRCSESVLSRILKELEQYGYISREGKQRGRTIRIIYNASDNDIASRSRASFARRSNSQS